MIFILYFKMKRENVIKMWIVTIVVILFSFSDWSLAAEWTASLLNETAKWLHLIVSILSWIWILFAQWAWEFMTNKWVYGEIIWLDAILWQYWNVIKNIANFWLWFYFVYTVFKWLIDLKSEVIKSVKDKLLWVLIAWIWIQTSWFMVAAIVDMSTITLVAASSLPSQIVANNPQVKQSFDKSLQKQFNPSSDIKEFEKWIWVSLFPSDRWAFDFITVDKERRLAEPMSQQELFDKIMPNWDNVSWPLHYLWLSILDTMSLVSLNTATDNWVKATIFNILLQSLTTIVYSLEMMVLFVVAVMRVVYIWIFIVLSPIVFLLRCIKQADKNVKFNFLDGVTKHFNLSSFFWNVFKPTIIVLGFSLTIIFVTVMNSIIQSNTEKTLDMWWVKTHNRKESSMGDGWNQKYETVMDSDMVWLTIRSAWKTLLEFIMCIITVVLVYYIIKIAVLMWDWKDFLSTKIKSFQNGVWDAITKLPVMPVAGYDKEWKRTTRYLSVGKVFGLGRNENLLESKIWHSQKKVQNEYNRQNAILDSWFGNETWYLSVDQVSAIETAMTTGNDAQVWNRLEKTKAEINKLKQWAEKWQWFGMTLSRATAKNDGFWLKQFGQRLTKMEKQPPVTGTNEKAWNGMIGDWNSSEIREKNIEEKLEKIFDNHQDRVRAYAEFFGLGSDIDTWQKLKNADISKKE